MTKIVAITGPSLAGKTTLVNSLNNTGKFNIPKHVTTREKRIDDVDGFYKYLSVDEFIKLQNNGEFLISSGVDKRFYGILKEDCEFSANNNDYIITISYKDIFQYSNIEHDKLLITLTFTDISKCMLYRYLNMKEKTMSYDELQIRIKAALLDNKNYFEIIKSNSDCLIYTDIDDKEKTLKKVLNKINKY